MKVAVTSLMKLKVGRKEIIKQIQKDIAQFKSQKKEIDKVLRTDPSIAELEKTLYQTNILLGKENRSIQMWKERKRLLVLLQKEFKSITAKGIAHLLLICCDLFLDIVVDFFRVLLCILQVLTFCSIACHKCRCLKAAVVDI